MLISWKRKKLLHCFWYLGHYIYVPVFRNILNFLVNFSARNTLPFPIIQNTAKMVIFLKYIPDTYGDSICLKILIRLKGWAWLWSSWPGTTFLTAFAYYFALFFLSVSSAWIIMDLCFLFFIWVMFQIYNTVFKYSLKRCFLLGLFSSTVTMEHQHPTNEIQVLAWWTVSQMTSPQPVVSKFHIKKTNILFNSPRPQLFLPKTF